MEAELIVDQINSPILETEQAVSTEREGITVAHLVMGAVVALGILVRWTDLGAIPFSDKEAAEALVTVGGRIGSPAYASLTTLLQAILGNSDAAVRVIPALFGTGALILCWQLREWLGRGGAIIMALVLAVSPIQAQLAREAGGDALAVLAGVTLVWAILKKHDLVILATALALGLTASPLTLIIFIPILLASLSRTRQAVSLRDSGIVFGGLIFVLGTRFGTQFAGLGGIAEVFTGFFETISLPPQSAWLTFPVYEPLTMLLLLPAVIVAVMRQRWFGLVWWVLAVVLAFFTQTPASAAGVSLASAFLIGMMADGAIENITQRSVWISAVALLVGGGIGIVGLGRVLRFSTNQLAPIIVLTALIVVLFYLTFVFTQDYKSLLQAGLIAILGTLIFIHLGKAWRLTHETANHPREYWTRGETITDSDLRAMVSTLEDGSYQLTRDKGQITTISLIDTSATRWALRGFYNIEYAETVPADSATQAILAPAGYQPRVPDEFASTTFDLTQSLADAGSNDSESPISDQLRWWFFGENKQSVISDSSTLWLRNNR